MRTELSATKVPDRYRLKKMAVALAGLFLLLVTASVAYVLCSLQLRNVTQEILAGQRDTQQAWVDKSLEAVRAWEANLLEQIRFVSAAEIFRLYAVDVGALSPASVAALDAPDAARSDDAAVAGLAEQKEYLWDLLRDTARGRQWAAARIVGPQGQNLVADADAPELGAAQWALAQSAMEQRAVRYGPVRPLGGGLVMDVAAPLYEVLGQGGKNRAVAALLVSVPMDGPLAAFLTVGPEQQRLFAPLLLQLGAEGPEALVVEAGAVRLEPLREAPAPAPSVLLRRPGALGAGPVYAVESALPDLGWRIVAEAPAAGVEGLLLQQKKQIYGLGILGSLGAALLLAFVWAMLVSRAHRATARHFKGLYVLIQRQKALLDSVNASLQAGLLLVDGQGRALMCNPAFARMLGRTEDEVTDSLLTALLPDPVAQSLLRKAQGVDKEDAAGSLEITLGEGAAARLYRVTLFPFAEQDEQKGGGQAPNSCVGIFQDITEFRRRAEAERARQASSMAALIRAVESVDPNLVGHSQKMERLVQALTPRLGLSERAGETLRMASLVSQVGRLFVPRDLLTKTGRLNPEEQQQVMRAPEYAYQVLRDLRFDLPVPEAVYAMGERMDGSGHPRGLQGAAIDANGRILAVVNAFCAMTSSRSYRVGMSPEEAVRQLRADQGFDQTVVEALADLPTETLQAALRAAPGRAPALMQAAGPEASGGA